MKQSSWSEVVSTTSDAELLVRSQMLFRVFLHGLEAIEDAFSDAILMLYGQATSLSLCWCFAIPRRVSALCGRQM
jgi:hypothetical protein